MNKKILVAIALTLALVMSLSSCSFLSNLWESYVSPIFKGPTVELTDAPLNAEKIVDFTQEVDPSILFESDGWSNGDVFNVVWKSHNVVFENGIMRLGITEEKATAYLDGNEVEFNYTAGEARTQNYYHYGDYEVSMKPSANNGTASTFFVCTGPYDVKNGTPNAHDEIDIEFLGKDTTKVQFNFFVGGQGGNEYMYDLGFDASKEFHRYGFRWAEDSITWFVDGVPVYKVTTNKNATTGNNLRVVEKLPSTAGRMLTNYWCGNERAWGWMGEYKGAVNDNGTEYQWIATSAEGAPLNPVETPETDNTDINWAEITPVAPTFASTELYTVAIEGNKANVTYTAVGGSDYKNVEMNIADAAAGKNHVYLKVTNNGTETVNVRVNVVDQALVDAGAQNMATNVSATMNGAAVKTDLVWGGSFFDILAGETAELVVKFGGEVELLQLMIDSSKNDATVRSGDITVEDIKFATFGEVTTPDNDNNNENDDPVTPPADPISGDLTAMIGDVEVQLGGNVTDGYGVNANDENGTINVTYTNISTNTYKNVWANIATIANGKNEVSLKIKNNGTATAYITVKLETAAAAALMEGKMEIPAGEEQAFTQTFEGVAEKLYFFIDSGWSTDTTTHAGEVVISDIAFAGESAPVDPTPTPQPEYTYNDLYVEFKTEDAYTLTSENQYTNNVNVTYSNIAQNSWNNINIWVADKSADCTRFSMKLTNNGTAQVSVWVQMKDEAGDELINQNVNIAAGATEVFTFDYTGTAQMIFFFVDSTHEAAAGPNAGNITISEIKLGKVAATEEPAPDPAPALPNDGEYVKFEGDAEYISNPQDYANVIGITYSGVNKDSYKCINTWVQDKATGKTIVTFAVRNNGTETVGIMVKVQTVAEVAKGEGAFTVAAGETKTFTLNYTDTPDMFFLFIDSAWNATDGTHSGDITIAGIKFQ